MVKLLQQLWTSFELPETALEYVDISDGTSSLSSSFLVGAVAQTTIAAAALSAVAIYFSRSGARQSVRVKMSDAEKECSTLFTLDGVEPETWAKYSGLYQCRDGFVRVHANFDHHRDNFLSILGLPSGNETDRGTVVEQVLNRNAEDLESSAAEHGAIISMARTFEQWDLHEHARATKSLPLLSIEKVADCAPIAMSPISEHDQPLSGVKVLELTRVLAGPICGRTLAAYGADVMLVNSPNLPNIEHIADTSRGKLSTLLDLDDENDRQKLRNLIKDCDVFIQGYRPGGLADKGFDIQTLAKLKPGIICVNLSAYGHVGPWSGRRGFDSIVQTATGFNHAEAEAANSDSPKAFPVQILDYATGFLMAFAAQAALLKRSQEGGSWEVNVSLLQTANWIRSLGRSEFELKQALELENSLTAYQSDYGELRGMPHAAEFSKTPARWARPSVPPGTNLPVWP